MRVGILGSGDVGQALGEGFLSRGHEVKIGSRDPKKLADWVEESGAKASAGTFAEVAKWGELIVLATLWSGTKGAIDLAGPASFEGKVVIDVTNPLLFEENKGPKLALGHSDSGGEQVQRWLPGAKVVKAFNTVGHAHMVDPKFSEGRPDMFICGDDAGAKATVAEITKSFGWGVIDAGGLDGSRLIEPLCILWVDYGLKTGTWNHAFKLLTK
jgi:8-hydroxy-5-deazaflavin:NADPH oxidoreductase